MESYQSCDWQEGLHYGAQLAVCYAGQMVDLCVGEAESSLSLNLGQKCVFFFGKMRIQNSDDNRFSEVWGGQQIWDHLTATYPPFFQHRRPVQKIGFAVSYPQKCLRLHPHNFLNRLYRPRNQKHGLQLRCVLSFSLPPKKQLLPVWVGRVFGGENLQGGPETSLAGRQRQGRRWLRSMSSVGVPVSSLWWLWLWDSCRYGVDGWQTKIWNPGR